MLSCFKPCFGQATEDLEQKIKAAYLYNFTKFISWPGNVATTFNVCIFGETLARPILSSLESKTAFDKPIRVYFLSEPPTQTDCHIAYFDQLDGQNQRNYLQAGSLGHALTVGNAPRFAENGGMIGFVLEEEKVKLHINLQAFKRVGLGISAKLIEVATLVEDAEHE